MYPVMGEKQMSKRVRWDQRVGSKVAKFLKKSEHYITSLFPVQQTTSGIGHRVVVVVVFTLKAVPVSTQYFLAWRKEEVDAARHRQEKREATRLGTLLSQTGV